jgi:hypothetical protein
MSRVCVVPTSCAGDRNEWTYTSTPVYTFVAWTGTSVLYFYTFLCLKRRNLPSNIFTYKHNYDITSLRMCVGRIDARLFVCIAYRQFLYCQ